MSGAFPRIEGTPGIPEITIQIAERNNIMSIGNIYKSVVVLCTVTSSVLAQAPADKFAKLHGEEGPSLQSVSVAVTRLRASERPGLHAGRLTVAGYEFRLETGEGDASARLTTVDGQVALEVAGEEAPLVLGNIQVPPDSAVPAGAVVPVDLEKGPGVRVVMAGYKNGVPYPGSVGNGAGLLRKHQTEAELEVADGRMVHVKQISVQKLSSWKWVDTGVAKIESVTIYKPQPAEAAE